MSSSREWEAYFIPGTQTLRNKFVTDAEPYGVSDQRTLEVLERRFARLRMIELEQNPIDGDFDYDHMKAIHRYIFQDVYEWAGQERTVSMSKEGHRYWPAGPGLKVAADHRYELLAAANFLRGLERADFVAELAEHWAEINVVHSFREGNTRSQFVFFDCLSRRAGWNLDVAAFGEGGSLREPFVQARFEAQRTGESEALRQVLDRAITPLQGSKVESESAESMRVSRLRLSQGVSQAKLSSVEKDLMNKIVRQEKERE